MQVVQSSSIWVVLGEHTHSTSGETNLTMKYAVDKIKIHKNNKGKPSQVDIALLRVKGVIDISGKSQTITQHCHWREPSNHALSNDISV